MPTHEDPTVAVSELHALFQSWFRGEGPADAMARFECSLDPELRMVVPAGEVLERGPLLELLRSNEGQRAADHVVSTRAEQLVRRGTFNDGSEWALALYEEWAGPADAVRGRQSSVLMVADAAAVAGWRWLHVHETWLSESS
ncbi:MAG: hypothetical protein ACYS26_17510 [Planctomycetota bacterium]|jgi:hypothetical protein